MSVTNPYHLGNYYNNISKQLPLLYKYQYILEFVGGGTYFIDNQFKKFTLFDHDQNNPDQNFSYWAQSAKIPKFEIPKVSVPYYATDFRIPACMKYEHNFQTKILLDQDLTMYNKLDTWLKMISRLQLSGGGMKTIPTIKMRIRLLDSEHQYFTTSIVMEGVWINKLGPINLKYAAGDATPLTVDVEFRMQYYYKDDDEQNLSMDPLSQAKILAAYGQL